MYLENISICKAALICAFALASGAVAASDLKLSYEPESKAERKTAPLIARASADVDTPLRLEYELSAHVERMAQTTQELRNIVETMPGPGLPTVKTTVMPTEKFASPIAETMVRLKRVEQLIADISHIIAAMPFTGKDNPGSPPIAPLPPLAPAAPTSPTPPAAPASPVVASTPDAPKAPVAEAPAPMAKTQVEPPKTEPVSVSATLPDSTIRAIWLAAGGIFAVLLGTQLRRMYMRRRPTTKQLAASIEAPPLKDEAIELADVMTSMGMGDGAAEALVQRIKANPRQSLSHWLKLLEVYRQNGQKRQFEQAKGEIRLAFNVNAGDWDVNDSSAEENTSLENFSHVAAQLKKLWPRPECAEYLLSLLADNRQGSRVGFPLAVVEEIVLLLAVLRPLSEES